MAVKVGNRINRKIREQNEAIEYAVLFILGVMITLVVTGVAGVITLFS